LKATLLKAQNTPASQPPRKGESSASKARPSKLPDLAAGTPREVWQRYFAEQQPAPETVVEFVRLLHEQQRYEHTIALIEVALIEQPPQPWMYEVLAISMELAKRPQEDIERVLLSRSDFTAAIVPEMMLSAAYLKRMGFHERALKMYQQAARLSPARPEPYLRGLQIARDLNDAAGIQWGATGVLTNVWLPGYEAHHREAEGIAAAVEETLRKAGKKSEADSIKQSMIAAHQRDLMLTLSWSGNADLDLSVEEPNGGICSFENPFTTAGGAYTHDGYGPKAENCYEEYICASALPGDYLVRVKLLDGDVVGRRAVLKIRRYVGTPQESTKSMTIPIDGKDKVVRLSLNDGRRLALAERSMIDANENVLQQGAAAGQFASGGSRGFVTGANAVTGGRQAIGFQPVITNISEGISLSAIAIVTGDRRYVRLSVAPVFNTIIGVDTFTIPSAR
jgi:tetratricopeptide (TPR) repeat protein